MLLRKHQCFSSLELIAITFLFAYSGNALAGPSNSWFARSSGPSSPKSLTVSSVSGGLIFPDGKVLNDGDLIFGINNDQSGVFSKYARGTNYVFGLGILPHLELTGRLADYPINREGLVGVRDLSANIKFSIPKFSPYQPDIAIGKNDLGGGAPFFQSKYLVASEDFGPLQVRAGFAKGDQSLNGKFAGVSFRFGRTGFTGIVDKASRVTHAGIRYISPQFSSLNALRFSASLQRSRGDLDYQGRKSDRTTASLNLIFSLGQKESQIAPPAQNWQHSQNSQNFEYVRVSTNEQMAVQQANANIASNDEREATSSAAGPSAPTPHIANADREPNGISIDREQNSKLIKESQDSWVQQLKSALFAAGIERVRVGKLGNELVVEYENHHYNQNEVDALGVVLGVVDKFVPSNIERIAAATKKAGLRISKTSVNRALFHQFLIDDDMHSAVRDTLSVEMGGGVSEKMVWLDNEEGKRGFSRIRIEPYLVKFVGTEFGVLDHSLSANIQGYVPLWTGAEFVSSYIGKLSESANVEKGIFSYAKQRVGVKTAVITQAFWASDRIFNQSSAGKYSYDRYGFENETTWLLPKDGDYLRFQIANLWDNTNAKLKTDFTYGASYMWKYNPLSLGVEVSFQRYVGNDYGPKIQVNRWFGDVNAQMYLRKSNLETRVGFGLVFPLTTRKGMSPNITHLEGTGGFSTRLETQLAKPGECNCITRGPVEERAFAYASDHEVFNRNRFGKAYVSSQLIRIRESALQFAQIENSN